MDALAEIGGVRVVPVVVPDEGTLTDPLAEALRWEVYRWPR